MADDNKSPLDVLEEILEENKETQAASKKAEQEAEAQQQQVLQQKIAQQQQVDQVAIEHQKQNLQNVVASDEIQERERQIKEERAENAAEKEAQQGHQIRQLEHTKV